MGAPGWVEMLTCKNHRGGTAKVESDLSGYFEMAKVPKRYRGARFADFYPDPDRAALVEAQAYVKDWPPRHPFLTLMSERKGNGKTMLAVATLTEAQVRHQVQARFWPVVDVLDRYKASFGSEFGLKTEDIDAELRRVPLLILDDLGAEKGTEWTRERLYSLINARYNDLSPTIFTTNVDLAAFDERIASRLMDHRTGNVVELVGRDRRAA